MKENVLSWFRKNCYYILGMVLFGTAVYFMLMSEELVNCYDGNWMNSNYLAGTWERSIGRWLWPYLDKLRFGVVSVSLNSFLTLILEAVTAVFLVDLFQIRDKLAAFLVGAIFISGPITCDILSYAYMSPTFGMAFLLSVIACVFLKRIHHPVLGVILCAVSIACSMGCYQAYLGVTCVLMLFLLLEMILKKQDLQEIGLMIVKMASSVVAGGALYKIIITLVNWIYHVDLADYRGMSSISVKSILLNLPRMIPQAYIDFYNYFASEGAIQKNVFWGNRWIYFGIFAAAGIFLIRMFVKRLKSSPVHTVLLLAVLALIPVACNVSILIASGNPTILLMCGGMAVLPGLILCLMYVFEKKSLLYHVYTVILCLSVWVNICIVTNDQIAMRDGRTSVETITQNIVTELMHDGYLDEKPQVAFVGSPYKNKFFNRTVPFDTANDYAQFGRWWVETENNRRSWHYGMLLHWCGIDLDWCGDTKYNEILASGQIEEMNCFPEDDSIRVIGDVVVVKVSDKY